MSMSNTEPVTQSKPLSIAAATEARAAFADAASNATALAAYIAAHINQSIAQKGHCSLAFSGGSTPAAMFKQLADYDLDWTKVQVTLVDERCVAADHERSNARLLADTLLQAKASAAHLVPLFMLDETAVERELRLGEIKRPFDLVHLGMGADSHTASFFPDAANLAAMLDLNSSQFIQTTQSENSREQRLTWSLAELLACPQLVLQISGASKLQVLAQALQKLGAASDANARQQLFLEAPIAAVLARCELGLASDAVLPTSISVPMTVPVPVSDSEKEIARPKLLIFSDAG